jgi:hypothetical protein
MRRTHLDPLPGDRIHPAAKNSAARENERMLAVLVDNGQFEIAIKRRGRDRLPHALFMGRLQRPALI